MSVQAICQKGLDGHALLYQPSKRHRTGFQFFFHNVLLHLQHYISKSWRPILPCCISGLSYSVTCTIFQMKQCLSYGLGLIWVQRSAFCQKRSRLCMLTGLILCYSLLLLAARPHFTRTDCVFMLPPPRRALCACLLL